MRTSPKSFQNQIKLNEKILSYNTIYSDRAKYIRLQIVNNNEIEVILPRRFKHNKAVDFILQKKDWILKHIKEKPKTNFSHLGRNINVFINYNLFIKKPQITYANDKLIVNYPAGYDSFSHEEIYNIWLRHKAKTYIPQRVKTLSEKRGLSYTKITLRSQKTRWGSCSTGGRLSFNYKLMKFRKEVIDYIIIHELCHIKEMNHSKNFWKLVEKFCPDYKKLKSELR